MQSQPRPLRYRNSGTNTKLDLYFGVCPRFPLSPISRISRFLPRKRLNYRTPAEVLWRRPEALTL